MQRNFRFKILYIPLPKLLQGKRIKQVQVIPQDKWRWFQIAFTYIDEKEYTQVPFATDIRACSIDLGVNNLASMIDTVEGAALIVNGSGIKSINQWFNKKLALLKSLAFNENKLYMTARIRRLCRKRNNKLKDYFHKVAEAIIRRCRPLNINEIIIGKNKEWKKNVNLGKVNNQKFVQIPYNKLIHYLSYRAKRYGIKVIEQEESYTSKCDALALEEIVKQKSYTGRRVKRGLFKSSIGKFLNADINSALNILRKCKGKIVESWIRLLACKRSCVQATEVALSRFRKLVPIGASSSQLCVL